MNFPKPWVWVFTLLLWIGLVPLSHYLAVQAGVPQAVWFYCHKLGWCAPTELPYCPPDPVECD